MQGLVTKANKEQEQITLLKQRKDAKSAYERMKKKYIFLFTFTAHQLNTFTHSDSEYLGEYCYKLFCRSRL